MDGAALEDIAEKGMPEDYTAIKNGSNDAAVADICVSVHFIALGNIALHDGKYEDNNRCTLKNSRMRKHNIVFF